MKKYIQKLFINTAMTVTLLAGVSCAGVTGILGGHVFAASPTDSAKAQVCDGVSGQTGGKCGDGGVDLNKIIASVLNILSVIAGIAAVIMIIIGGMKYITSSGDAQAVSGAKKTIMYAVVGLVVVALAQFIVRFVLTNAQK